jgi:hypothetical protein
MIDRVIDPLAWSVLEVAPSPGHGIVLHHIPSDFWECRMSTFPRRCLAVVFAAAHIVWLTTAQPAAAD